MEREIIRRAKKGDEGAIKEIFDHYKKMIYKVGQKYFSQIEDKDDFEQIARIGIWEAIKKFRLEPVFRATIKKGKIIRWELVYDKHDVDFGKFAFMYTRKNTNLSVRKERRRVKLDFNETPTEGMSLGEISTDMLDKVVCNVKGILYREIMDAVYHIECLEGILDKKSPYRIQKSLGIDDKEYERMECNLKDLVKSEVSYISSH